MTTPDPSRAAFEQWYSTAGENPRSVERQEDGRYIYVPTEVCWVKWQAAMAHKGPDCWQSIETAPKDGTEVWAFNGEQARMRWIEGPGYALWVWVDELLEDADPSPDQPTHWRPLPAAPKQEGGT